MIGTDMVTMDGKVLYHVVTGVSPNAAALARENGDIIEIHSHLKSWYRCNARPKWWRVMVHATVPSRSVRVVIARERLAGTALLYMFRWMHNPTDGPLHNNLS